MWKSLFIAILFLCWRPVLAGPMEALRLQDSMDGLPLGSMVEYLLDHERKHEESTIASVPPGDWTRLDVPYRNFGHLHAPVWVRFALNNTGEHSRTVYLENNYSLTDQITLVEAESPETGRQILGDQELSAKREIRYRNPLFVIHVKPGTQYFFMKIDTSDLVTLALKVWDPVSFNNMMSLESMLIGLLFGITIALLLYNAILYFSTRITLLKAYCFYILFFILTEFCLIGVSQLLVKEPAVSSWLANSGFRLFLTMGIFSALFFMRLFLKLKTLRPRLDALTKGLMFALLLLGVYQLFDGPEANRLSSLGLSLSSIHFLVSSIVLWRDGYRPARILLLAWTLIVIGSGVASVADLGLIDGDMGQILLWHFAAGCLEMILLSLAIGEWWRQERLRRRQESARADAIRIAIQAKQDHAFDQLKKIIYPHQLERIMDGQQLEQTMPVGKALAAVIAFDIVASSQVEHDTIQEFMRQLFARCHALMMKNYQPLTLEANAYRIKETGDGFLCSIGYPFKAAEGKPLVDVAVSLAQEFVRVFSNCLTDFPSLQHLTCCCGVALDRVESFFPKQGVQVYDLYGRAIVLATRYEALRKELRIFTKESSYILLQDRVYQNLSDARIADFERMALAAIGLKARDDADAVACYFQRIHGSQSAYA